MPSRVTGARVVGSRKVKNQAVLLVAGHWLMLSVAINIGFLLKIIHDGNLGMDWYAFNGNGVAVSSLASYTAEPKPGNDVQIQEKYINLDQ